MSAFDNARMAPRIGLSEEQAQLLDIAESFCRDKSPVDKVRALIEEEDGLTPLYGTRLPNWVGSALVCRKIMAASGWAWPSLCLWLNIWGAI